MFSGFGVAISAGSLPGGCAAASAAAQVRHRATKAQMVYNAHLPAMRIDPQTFELRAGGLAAARAARQPFLMRSRASRSR